MRATRNRIGVMAAAMVITMAAAGASGATTLLPVNNGFEADTYTVFPGYISGNGGTLTGWTANDTTRAGINPSGGSPFADNGAIPEGTQVAFVQSTGNQQVMLSQNVGGFTVGDRYVLWYRENSRSGFGAPNAWTDLGGSTVVAAHAVNSVGGGNQYRTQATGVFTATGTNYQLDFHNQTAGDATLLIDNVRFDHYAASEGTVYNHSFEYDSFYTFPGYSSGVDNGPISGWSSTDTSRTGISPWSGGAEFANNGAIPDGRQVAFIQSGANAMLSTTVTDLQIGKTYQIDMRLNSRGPANLPIINVVSGADTLMANQGITSVGAANPYRTATFYYTATATTATFSIQNIAGGDHTVLVDNISYTETTPAWAQSDWDNDATSGIVAGGLYSHAYNFGSASNAVVNGVLFRGINGGNPSNNAAQLGGDFAVSGIGSDFNGDGNELTVAGGGSGVLGGNFIFGGNPGTIQLTGLIKNYEYKMTIFGVGFDTVPGRASTFVDPLTGARITVDESGAGNDQGVKITYVYTTDSSGTATINLNPLNTTSTFHVYAMANQALATTGIAGLYNTGVDDNGNPLGHGVLDTHWDIVAGPQSLGDPRTLTSAGAFPIGPWLSDNSTSAWIGPNTDDDSNAVPGSYVYQTQFLLDSNTAKLIGRFAADNSVSQVLLNGVDVGISGTGFGAWIDFMIDAGFIEGLNTLQFFVTNGAPTGPTALRVEFTTAIQAYVPAPAALPAGLAMMSLITMRRRRR